MDRVSATAVYKDETFHYKKLNEEEITMGEFEYGEQNEQVATYEIPQEKTHLYNKFNKYQQYKWYIYSCDNKSKQWSDKIKLDSQNGVTRKHGMKSEVLWQTNVVNTYYVSVL